MHQIIKKVKRKGNPKKFPGLQRQKMIQTHQMNL